MDNSVTRIRTYLEITLVFIIVILICYILQDSIKIALLGTVGFNSVFHAYIIGLFFPEAFYGKLCWNMRAGRATKPISKKFMTDTMFLSIGAGVAIFGIVFNTFVLAPALNTGFTAWIISGFSMMLLYATWLIISLFLLPFIFYGIASPAGAHRVIRSLRSIVFNHERW